MAAQATKADIEALEQKLDATRDELRQELHATRDELRQELHATREGLETKIRANGIMLERLDAKVDAIIQALPDEKYQPPVSLLVADVRKNTRRIANVEKRLKRAR